MSKEAKELYLAFVLTFKHLPPIIFYVLDVDANSAAVADEEVDKLSSCASATDEAPAETDVTSESPSGIFDNFTGLLQNAKLTVIELVSMVSSYLKKIFPIPDTPNADGNNKASFMDNNIGMQGTFLGLAVLVIMVIMTKRVSS